jgi:hypothetical protein
MSRDHPDLNDYYQLYLFNYENERIIFLHNSFKVCYRCVCFLFIDQKSKYYINNPLTFDVGKKPWKNRKILKLWYVGQLEIFIIIYREEIKFESESRPQTRKNSSRSRFFFCLSLLSLIILFYQRHPLHSPAVLSDQIGSLFIFILNYSDHSFNNNWSRLWCLMSGVFCR